MYNDKIKEEYIRCNNRENSDIFEQNMKMWFEKASVLEKTKKKDLSEFSVGEIIDLYHDYIRSSSVPYLTWVHGYFREYANWVNANNHFGEITSKMITMCIDKDKERSRIVSRDTLLNEIELFRNALEKALVLGLFEGIRLIDFENLLDSDIDGNIVHIKNRGDLTVSRRLSELLMEAGNTYEFIPHNDDSRFQISRYTVFQPDDHHIIKNFEYSPNSDRMVRLHVILQKCRESYGFQWISASELPQSGAANMLLELTKNNPNKAIEEIAREHLEEIRYRYGSSWVYKARFKNKYGFMFQ